MTSSSESLLDRTEEYYRGLGLFNLRSVPILPELAFVLQPGARVLDIGGGAGNNALPLGQAGSEVTVMDQSPTAVRKLLEFASALDTQGQISGMVADAADGLPARNWDAVIMSQVLHFIPRARATVMMAEAQQITATGGYHMLVMHMDESNAPDVLQGNFLPTDETEIMRLYPWWELVTSELDHCGCGPIYSLILRKTAEA